MIALASLTPTELAKRVAELEATLMAEREAAAAVAVERDRLRAAYQRLQLELELVRRRMFVAKAERIDTAQLELEFAEKLAALDALTEGLDSTTTPDATTPAPGQTGPGTSAKKRPAPTGRRDLTAMALPEERIEVIDPLLEGIVERIGWEESSAVVWRRGGFVRQVTARAKYRDRPVAKAPGAAAPEPQAAAAPVPVALESAAHPRSTRFDETPIVTAEMPPTILPRSIATASLLAHIIAEKFCDGLPLFRQEDRFARLGFRIDRGTLCRWVEEVGGIVGATIIHAMREDALNNAFCIATDATGVLVQPIRDGGKKRAACRRGHYFVQIADRDHVFFEYTPRETSAAVKELFRGFSGYVQADAKSVYDLLFRPPDQRPPPDDGEPDLAIRHEVGCWSHARRRFWEAAIAKDPVAREALARIMRIFDLDRMCRARPSPAEVQSLRQAHLRPHVDAFFLWAAAEYELVQNRRGLLRAALGYAVRQKHALVRFFDDGRLRIDNNASERELRRVAIGRKAWLFVGSDDHAQAAGNHLTLIASARLHQLDPEAYLRDLYRVLPHWPRDRYLELCPRDWFATRARLDPAQLEMELGPLTISPPPSEKSPSR